MLTESRLEIMNGRDHSEDVDIDGRIIPTSQGNRVWGVNWPHPAQDRDQWRALVNTVMNLRVP
jgi:hypothetical protein